jgi:hypothetical protein
MIDPIQRNNTHTRVREIEEHLELAALDTCGPNERDERLDSALEAARLEFLVAITPTWDAARREYEDHRGTPYVYVRTGDSWLCVPLGFAEIEGGEGEDVYALTPLAPSSRQLSELVAQNVDREEFARAIVADSEIEILTVHAIAPPLVVGLSRADVLDAMIRVARNEERDEDPEALGPWGGAVQNVTLIHARANTTYSK